MQIFDFFADNKKAIYSAYEGLVEPWTDEGYDKCMDAMRTSGNQWRKIQSTSHAGRIEKRKRGELGHIMFAPYGYVKVRRRIKPEKKNRMVNAYYLELDSEEKQDVVRMIFRLSREGQRDRAIMRLLNKARIPSPTGKKWTQQTIGYILRNTAYIGYVLSGKGTPDEARIPCPRILEDDSDWIIAQGRNKENHAGRNTELHQLQGKIYCAAPDCNGHRMNGQQVGRGYRRYKCYRKDEDGNWICHAPGIKGEWVEDSVWQDVIVRQCGDAQTLLAALHLQHRQAAGRTHARDDREKLLAKKKGDLKLNEQNLDTPELQYRRGELLKANTELRAEIATLESERKSDNVFEMPTARAVEALAAAIRRMGEWTTFKERRPVIDKLIGRIDYFDRNYEVEINLPKSAIALESGGSFGSNGDSRNRQTIEASFVNFTSAIPLKFKGRVA
jgi:ketosteroid isomerase-like protein